MNDKMTMLVVATLLLGVGACATRPPASAPGAVTATPCPVNFQFHIPADAGNPPEMVEPSPRYQRGSPEWSRDRTVMPGCVPNFRATFAQGAQDGRVFVVFHEDTPFVDARGREVWTFLVADSPRLQVRPARDGKCGARSPCKYSVVHTGLRAPSQYPPYDPWIIIHGVR